MPSIYPEGRFQKDREPEIEWVCYLSSNLINADLPLMVADGDNGTFTIWSPIGEHLSFMTIKSINMNNKVGPVVDSINGVILEGQSIFRIWR